MYTEYALLLLLHLFSAQDNLVSSVPEWQTILGFGAERDDGRGACDTWNSDTYADHITSPSIPTLWKTNPEIIIRCDFAST